MSADTTLKPSAPQSPSANNSRPFRSGTDHPNMSALGNATCRNCQDSLQLSRFLQTVLENARPRVQFFSPVCGRDLFRDMTFSQAVWAAFIPHMPETLNIGKEKSACRCKESLVVTMTPSQGKLVAVRDMALKINPL